MSLSATGVGIHSDSTTATLTVAVSATGGAGRVIVVVCSETNSNGNPATVSNMSGLSATWHKRSSITNSVFGQATEEWYADFVASTSGTVTVTMSATIDDAITMAVFVSSSTSATITFDANASFPAPLHGSVTSATAGLTNVSSNSSAPYLLLMSGCANGLACGSPTPVSTVLESGQNVGGTQVQRANVIGGLPGALASTSSGYASVGASAGNPTWTIIIDALAEAAASGPAGLKGGGLGTGGLGHGGFSDSNDL